ncbi:MAG: hypothetical protein II326_06235 [Clostridia bacterium]|nr:hypothetical protein [Clostridia bacterium]
MKFSLFFKGSSARCLLVFRGKPGGKAMGKNGENRSASQSRRENAAALRSKNAFAYLWLGFPQRFPCGKEEKMVETGKKRSVFHKRKNAVFPFSLSLQDKGISRVLPLSLNRKISGFEQVFHRCGKPCGKRGLSVGKGKLFRLIRR